MMRIGPLLLDRPSRESARSWKDHREIRANSPVIQRLLSNSTFIDSTRRHPVRVALRAVPSQILQLVVEGLRVSVVGIVAGLIGAFVLTRLLRRMLVGVNPTDPATFGTVAMVLLLMAAVASLLPARRAVALDPS